jgi:hypothetical protein
MPIQITATILNYYFVQKAIEEDDKSKQILLHIFFKISRSMLVTWRHYKETILNLQYDFNVVIVTVISCEWLLTCYYSRWKCVDLENEARSYRRCIDRCNNSDHFPWIQ